MESKELREFRERWKRELSSKPKENIQLNENIIILSEEKKEEKELDPEESLARQYWEEASLLEQEGEYFEAVKYYKKAFKLSPDLEYEVRREFQIAKKLTPQPPSLNKNQQENHFEDQKHHAHQQVHLSIDKDSINFLPQWTLPFFESVIEPNVPLIEDKKHICDIPNELISHVFSYLGAFDLERVGRVCKIWFILSRDVTLWKKQCFKIWPEQEHQLLEKVLIHHGDWRRLFINKPKPRCDGVYISQNPYIRRGETEGSYVQPIFQITNWWYFRFYEDGVVLSFQTVEKPKAAVQVLNLNFYQVNKNNAKKESGEVYMHEKRRIIYSGRYWVDKIEGEEKVVMELESPFPSVQSRNCIFDLSSTRSGYQNRMVLESHIMTRLPPLDNISFNAKETKPFRFYNLPHF